MSDLATLGIAVDTQDLNNAIRVLASFKDQAKSAGKETSNLEKSLKNAAVAVGGFFAARKVFSDFKQAVDYIDDMSDSADRLGVSSESFSKLAYAAKMTEVPIGSLEGALRKMLLAMSEANADSNSGAASAFKDLRLNIDELNKSSPDEVFLKITDALNKVGTAADRAKLQQEIFGRGSAQLRDIMKLGSEEIRKFYTEAERLGLVIDQDMAQKAELAKQSFERLDSSYQGLMVAFADSGSIDILSEGLNDLATAIGTVSQYFREARAEKLAFENVVSQLDVKGLGENYREASKDVDNYTENLVSANERIKNLQENIKERKESGASFWTGGAGGMDKDIQDMNASLERNLKLRDDLVKKLGSAMEYRGQLLGTLDQKPVEPAAVPEDTQDPKIVYSGGGSSQGAKDAEDALKRAEMYYNDTRTAAEQYKITEAELDNLLAKKAITQETYNRSLALARDQYAEDAGAQQIFEDTRTAAENYNVELEKLNGLLENGLISQETYNRALEKAQDAYIVAQNESNKFFQGIESIGQAALDGQIRNFNDLAEVATATFGKILIEYVKSRAQIAALENSGGGFLGFLGNLAGGIFGGGNSGSVVYDAPIGPTLSGPPMAEGGSFTVPGGGGVDSKLVSFKASPGEQVNIARNGGGSSGGESRVEVNVYNSASGTKARTEERKNETGGKTIDVYIDEIGAAALSNPTSKMSKALRRNFGASPQLNQR